MSLVRKVMIINAGSSSIKSQLFVAKDDSVSVLWKGVVEGINTKNGSFTFGFLNKTAHFNDCFPTHKEAVAKILTTILEQKVVQNLQDIAVIGHRVVHGGSFFVHPTVVNEEVLKKLEAIKYLAPLHIPANLLAIKEFVAQTSAVNVAVFDTAFHSTIPQLNFLFPVKWSWYQNYGVRKYGFHGISYQYLVKAVEQILAVPSSKMNGIICHLGNGSSISAVKQGLSFETSMGLTPLGGLMMGTRCGDLDPSIFQYIHEKKGLDVNEIVHVLNKQSGFLGVSGLSSDLKIVEKAYWEGNNQAILAVDLFVKKVSDYIAVYFNSLGAKLDYLVFAGGIGENSSLIVEKVLKRLKVLALGENWVLPSDKTWKQKGHFFISSGPLKILLVQTNEELVICKLAIDLLKSV